MLYEANLMFLEDSGGDKKKRTFSVFIHFKFF